MEVNKDAFYQLAISCIDVLRSKEGAAIDAAASILARSILANGVVHAFGIGHSEALAMELAGRAGGLVPTNRLSLRDGIYYGGDDLESLGVRPERNPSLGRRIYELSNRQSGDVFVLISSSGVNGTIIEVARCARRDGHSIIGVVSKAHMAATAPGHSSGLKLGDLANVTVDNCAPFGDSVLQVDEYRRACGISSITGSLLMQMIVAETIGLLMDSGETPPLYVSANTQGGRDFNESLDCAYRGRIRRGL